MRLKNYKIYIIALLLFALAVPNVIFGASTTELLNMSDEVSAKKDKLDELEANLAAYKKKIDDARSKASTLKNQIDIANNSIKKTGIELQKTEIQIDKLDLEITIINTEISNTKKKIELQKEIVGYYLRQLQQMDAKSSLEIILLNRSFSGFFNELQYLEDLHDSLNSSVDDLKKLKQGLEDKQVSYKQKKEETLTLKNTLEDTKGRLESQKTVKTILIGQTFATESKFQSLLQQAQKEKQDLDAEIARLEKQIRSKLNQNDLLPYGGEVILTWPVPKNKITAYFHDPDYPYRYVYEHPGLDLRASQGTVIKAPAPGYVLKVRDQNSPNLYNYVVLVHAGGISTVYLHLSKVYVKPDTYVARGDIIGATGGTPGTRGAGYFTTGPHLHFEVRQNGIPVNPLNYLVSL